MPQVMLDRPGVLSIVGEFVARGMAQHVRVDGKRDPGLLTSPSHDFPHCIGGQRPSSETILVEKQSNYCSVCLHAIFRRRNSMNYYFISVG